MKRAIITALYGLAVMVVGALASVVTGLDFDFSVGVCCCFIVCTRHPSMLWTTSTPVDAGRDEGG